ncbi:aminotransferase, partial [Amaricoccus sp. HAR-UPW-R2A-40]
MALKFKETCGLHAEGYSAAEVLHGPAAIVRADFEMALKFKETCGLHAEGYSAAEVLHGPAAIVRADF